MDQRDERLKMKFTNIRRNLDDFIILVFEKPFLKITPNAEFVK